MHQKVKKLGIKKEKGYLYFLDDDGNISRVTMAEGGRGTSQPELVKNVAVQKSQGYLYFLDDDGDLARTKMEQ